MPLKPWRLIAEPHEDVRTGTFVQAEFAADISQVHGGTATKEYQDPKQFFERTFITEGMRLLLDSVVKRLAGKGGDPVIQLQTAFGGGKTHTMLAVYHLAQAKVPASEMPGVGSILNSAGITELQPARVAVLDGIKSSPNQPRQYGNYSVKTLWGELAWQLGGEEGYALVADGDQSGTSPGKDVLVTLLNRFSPCVILVDELVAYIRQFEEGVALTGGTFDSNLTFIQALTEALKSVPTAVMLASLPESEKEAGSQRGVRALEALSHYFGRVQALWKPVAIEEAFEIVRRRLFSQINDQVAAEQVCREFADYYIANSTKFPAETQESRYFHRLKQAYPIHPEVFDRLYEDWSSLDNFQRTRGVLKMMAKIIFSLWKDGNNDPLIMAGSLPFADADTRNDFTYYLPAGWDPVVDKDIDGPRAETVAIENVDTRLGAVQACRRTARTIFLGSAPTTASQLVRGIDVEHVLLGCAQPEHQLGLYEDALRRLSDKLHYLNSANNRYWFDTRPNLRREMEERKKRFKEREDIYPLLHKQLSGIGVNFDGIHIFTSSADIPDDWGLRLVVLAPDASYSKVGVKAAFEKASEILKQRGEQPRQKQNRLIFLAADADNVSRLKDHARSVLAWESIIDDHKNDRLTLDNLMAKNASSSLAQARDTLSRSVRETWKWLLAPVQNEANLMKVEWEEYLINPGATNFSQEIDRVLKENELLIHEWAPIHLCNMLKSWFWKGGKTDAGALDVWQKSCCYLYLPRLRSDAVFKSTLNLGVQSKEFFAVAQGKNAERYVGLVFGKPTSVILDNECLLVHPNTAAEIEAKRIQEEEAKKPEPTTNDSSSVDDGTSTDPVPAMDDNLDDGVGDPVPGQFKKQFNASVGINAINAKMIFGEVVDEVVRQFTDNPNVNVKIKINIEADYEDGFDASLQRSVKENCSSLKFEFFEFE